MRYERKLIENRRFAGSGWDSAKFSLKMVIFTRLDRPTLIIADDFHTKKLCCRLSSSGVRFYTKNGRFKLLSLFGGLRGNVRCLPWAHWKARSGLPISVNWTFFASFFRFVTNHAFDRRTDRQTDGRTDGRTNRQLSRGYTSLHATHLF